MFFELHIEVLNESVYCFSNRLKFVKSYVAFQTDSVLGLEDFHLI